MRTCRAGCRAHRPVQMTVDGRHKWLHPRCPAPNEIPPMTRFEVSNLAPYLSRYAGGVVLCLGALLAFRLVALAYAGTDLFFDEAQYWSWSRALDFGYFSKPPLIAWLIAGSGALCGQSEFCIRLASPILYTLAASLIFFGGPDALRRPHRILVGARLRDTARCFLFSRVDIDRCAVAIFLGTRASSLDQAA